MTLGIDPAQAAARLRDEIDTRVARNVIMFVGDGMGDSEVTAARNYLLGPRGRLTLDGFLLTGTCTNYALQPGAEDRYNYVTDSAAAATAWATGRKSYNGGIGVDQHGTARDTLVELARRAGMRTGIVTTEEVCDPTPAAMGAHVADRTGRGPDEMTRCPDQDTERGGRGSIAEQLVTARPDVLLGGGARYFRQRVRGGPYRGRPVLDQARATGYQVVTTATELTAADGARPVLGLFADGPLVRRWAGPPARPGGSAATRCWRNPELPADQPTLAEMTRRALALLGAGDPDAGFILLVEGGLIDNAGHDGDPCGMIGELAAFDEAIAVGLDFAAEDGDTLVLVTADHGHTCQIIPNDVKSPGSTTTLLAADGEPMTLNYATNLPGEIQVHTGAQVRVAARGPGAVAVLGVHDQTELFQLISRSIGVRKTCP